MTALETLCGAGNGLTEEGKAHVAVIAVTCMVPI